MTSLSPSHTPLSTATTAIPSSTPAPPSTSSFPFPPIHAFPPFFTLQPNPTTLSSQLLSWSTLIQSYCRHTKMYSLTLVDALATPLFTNAAIRRHLSARDARRVIDFMASAEGGGRAEWIPLAPTPSKLVKAATSTSTATSEHPAAYIFWRRPEEWASLIEEWVERTGQKGVVMTVYEIGEGDAARREEFWGMEAALLRRCLGVSVKRGRAQVFGGEGEEGVKFF